MYIDSINISKVGWDTPAEGEKIQYRGKVKFKGGEEEFTFVLDDTSTRLLVLCCMDRVNETADTFVEKIKGLIQPKEENITNHQ